MSKSKLSAFKSLPTKLWIIGTLLESIVDITIVAILLHNFTGVIDSILLRNESSVLPVYLGLFVPLLCLLVGFFGEQ